MANQSNSSAPSCNDDLKTWPASIWLQHQFEYTPSFEAAHRACSEITWCQDSVDRYDIEYVRADLATQPAEERAHGRLTDNTRTMVRFILENADKFEWSLQGLGMLRLYLTKDIRLHVWDLRYAFPGASPIHDHLQWGLASTVVSGRITNYRFTESADGEPYLYSTLKPGYGCYFKHEPMPIKLRRGQAEVYTTGMSYRQRASEIHRSVPDDGTVTLMRKTPTADADSARVFWPADEEWGSAEPRPATAEEVSSITQYALKVWDSQPVPRSSSATQPVAEEDDNCSNCHQCLEGKTTTEGIPIAATRMILCPDCGNKRCPKASDHALACTNSNEPGQVGSVYGEGKALGKCTYPSCTCIGSGVFKACARRDSVQVAAKEGDAK